MARVGVRWEGSRWRVGKREKRMHDGELKLVRIVENMVLVEDETIDGFSLEKFWRWLVGHSHDKILMSGFIYP